MNPLRQRLSQSCTDNIRKNYHNTMKNKKEPVTTFEDQLARLEEIVQTLDEGTAPIEELLKIYEEGMKVAEDCRKYLENAEQRITEIKKSAGILKRSHIHTEEDFDDEEIADEAETGVGHSPAAFKNTYSHDDDIGLPF